jgi:hypothetical protein
MLNIVRIFWYGFWKSLKGDAVATVVNQKNGDYIIMVGDYDRLSATLVLIEDHDSVL